MKVRECGRKARVRLDKKKKKNIRRRRTKNISKKEMY